MWWGGTGIGAGSWCEPAEVYFESGPGQQACGLALVAGVPLKHTQIHLSCGCATFQQHGKVSQGRMLPHRNRSAELANSPSHNTPAMGRQVLELTLSHQAPGRLPNQQWADQS